MQNEKLTHDLIVDHMRNKFSRDYNEARVNPQGSPDIVLGNHGLVLANVEVETEGSINPEKAEEWKGLVGEGVKLIIMAPKNSRVKVTELLWEKGIMDRVGVGTYEISIHMP
jgi:hypothetical protein